MKKFILILIWLVSASPILIAKSNHDATPVTAFYILKTKDFNTLTIKKSLPLSDSIEKLYKLSIWSGYFEGNTCHVYLRINGHLYSIEAEKYFVKKERKEYIKYTFRMIAIKKKELIFILKGNLEYKRKMTVKKEYKKDDYIIIFRGEYVVK